MKVISMLKTKIEYRGKDLCLELPCELKVLTAKLSSMGIYGDVQDIRCGGHNEIKVTFSGES